MELPAASSSAHHTPSLPRVLIGDIPDAGIGTGRHAGRHGILASLQGHDRFFACAFAVCRLLSDRIGSLELADSSVIVALAERAAGQIYRC